jgi:hypothetical protein
MILGVHNGDAPLLTDDNKITINAWMQVFLFYFLFNFHKYKKCNIRTNPSGARPRREALCAH